MKVRRIDFSPDEWIGGTLSLSNAERGLYITACALMYSRGGAIKIDELFSACVDHGNSLKSQLSRLVETGKLQRKGDEITNKRVRNELEKARKRSRNGRENVGKRWGKDRDLPSDTAKHNDITDEVVLQGGKTEPIPPRKANHQPSAINHQPAVKAAAAASESPTSAGEPPPDDGMQITVFGRTMTGTAGVFDGQAFCLNWSDYAACASAAPALNEERLWACLVRYDEKWTKAGERGTLRRVLGYLRNEGNPHRNGASHAAA